MPLKLGHSKKTISKNIKELHHGKEHAKTVKMHVKATADKQAVAIAMKKAGKAKSDPKAGSGKKDLKGHQLDGGAKTKKGSPERATKIEKAPKVEGKGGKMPMKGKFKMEAKQPPMHISKASHAKNILDGDRKKRNKGRH